MLVIIGKTASGKSAVVKELCKKGYKQLITYTTRPRRAREPKNAYHFISNNDFDHRIASGFFAEYQKYNTIHGEWSYGSAWEDYDKADDNTVAILTPAGYRMIKERLDIPIKSIYLYSNIRVISNRLKERGDNSEEVKRRIAADNEDFKGLVMEVDRIVYNESDDELKDVVQRIIDFDKKGVVYK